MAPRARPRSPAPTRPAVPLITLPDGILIEADGRTLVHIDVSAGSLVVHLAGREALCFGLSHGGLDDATRTAALLVRRAMGPRARASMSGASSVAPVPAPLPRQRHLFGDGRELDLVTAAIDETPGDEGGLPGRGDRLTVVLRDAILERCRVVARRREPRIDDVAARVFAFVDTPLVYSAAVLETPWLVDDVLRFRGAAIAVAMAETLPPPVRAAGGVRALIPYLKRWRSLFARDGLVTRSVLKSVALLDEPAFAAIPVHDVWRLRDVTLVQPIRSPRHLHLLAERLQLGGPHVERDLRLLQLADDSAIDRAVDEVAGALRLRRLALRQREHVLCEVLGQAEARPGDERLAASHAVQILVRRRLDAVREARRRLPRVAGVAPVAIAPPIPLPSDPRVRFLVTEEDFLTEGERMHHCVGAYFATAAQGRASFFHYEDEDGPATVRVSPTGVIEESKGICNAPTTSARRAAALLSTWSAPLTLLSLGDAAAVLWHGAGPVLDDDERPLRTLIELVQAVGIEFDRGAVRDVVIYTDLLRGAAERALRGEGWLSFERERQRVRERRAEPDDV